MTFDPAVLLPIIDYLRAKWQLVLQQTETCALVTIQLEHCILADAARTLLPGRLLVDWSEERMVYLRHTLVTPHIERGFYPSKASRRMTENERLLRLEMSFVVLASANIIEASSQNLFLSEENWQRVVSLAAEALESYVEAHGSQGTSMYTDVVETLIPQLRLELEALKNLGASNR